MNTELRDQSRPFREGITTRSIDLSEGGQIHVGHVPDTRGWVVLLPGLGASSSDPHIEDLARPLQEGGFSTISVDYPGLNKHVDGNGKHIVVADERFGVRTVSGSTIPEAIRHAQRLDPQPVVLAGHSFGAVNAVRYVHDADDHAEIAGVVLKCPTRRLNHSDWFRGMWDQWRADGHIRVGRMVLPWTYKEEAEGTETDVLLDAMRTRGKGVPTLMIAGEHDTVVPPSQVKDLFVRLAPHQKNDLQTVKEMTHDFGSRQQRDRGIPNRVASIVNSWVQTL